jgi:hypothetical protein
MSFHLAQEGVAATWEGVVEELGDAELVARLYDLTDPSREPEVATFSLDELSDDDLPLAKPGAVFYWSNRPSHRTPRSEEDGERDPLPSSTGLVHRRHPAAPT